MFCNHFFQKLKGLLVKVILEFWLHAVKLSFAWCETLILLNKALRFLKA